MELKNFQKRAVQLLINALDSDNKIVVLKSATGSGKTIILTHFIDRLLKESVSSIVLWLTPGKGNLEEQSRKKMNMLFPQRSTKLLSDVMIVGFEENDVCFINWELLTKKDNNAFKDGDRQNIIELVKKAKAENLNFFVVVDEEHVNDTYKADEILHLFSPEKIIRCSATPTNYINPILIEVNEQDVIDEGLIKKQIVINEDFEDEIQVNDQIDYLLSRAVSKQAELKERLNSKNIYVNPLVLIQIPNSSDYLIEHIERYLQNQNVTYDNKQLGIWLSNRKENLDEIEQNDNEVKFIIIKQAIATGWDCPRAYVLVKLRDNMSEVFEIQTIGRIRRMPEAKHYYDDILDSAYIYTFDERFVENVKQSIGKRALEAKKLYLKNHNFNLKLIKEWKSSTPIGIDPIIALRSIKKFYSSKYQEDSNKDIMKRMVHEGYIFSDNIIKNASTGVVTSLNENQFDNLHNVSVVEPLNTNVHGRMFHKSLSTIGSKIGLPYESVRVIIRRLFDSTVLDRDVKLFSLQTKQVYSFVINNLDILTQDFRSAMADASQQHLDLIATKIKETDYGLPNEFLFTYDSKSRIQRVLEKNVYEGYLTSAEQRSSSEKYFEKYCESNTNINWIYKNGDKGENFFSIVYQDNSGNQKLFYPDYILMDKNGEIWIIETKGGFDRSGRSEDIDIFSPLKFQILKKYLNKHNLNGGFVRIDKLSQELFICLKDNSYSDDIQSNSWIQLSEIL